MKTLKSLAYISVLINIYFFSLWTYIYKTSNSYEDRNARFNDSLPSFMCTTLLDILIVLLSIASVIYFAKTDRSYEKIIMAVQLMVILLLLFQHM